MSSCILSSILSVISCTLKCVVVVIIEQESVLRSTTIDGGIVNKMVKSYRRNKPFTGEITNVYQVRLLYLI